MITLAPGETLRGVAGTATAVTYTVFGMELVGGVESYKILTQGQLAVAAGVLYTAPIGTLVFIKQICLINNTASQVSGITLYVNGTAAANAIKSFIFPAYYMMTYTSGSGWKSYDNNGAELTSAVAASHGLGSSSHTADTLPNIKSKVSSGTLITSDAAEISTLTEDTTGLSSNMVLTELPGSANVKRKTSILTLNKYKQCSYMSYPWDWTTRVGYDNRLSTLNIGDLSWDASGMITGNNTVCMARIPVPQYWDLGVIPRLTWSFAGLFSEATNNDVIITSKCWILPAGQVIPADMSGYDYTTKIDIVTANKIYQMTEGPVTPRLVGGTADTDSLLIVKWNRDYTNEVLPYAHTCYCVHLKVTFALTF